MNEELNMSEKELQTLLEFGRKMVGPDTKPKSEIYGMFIDYKILQFAIDNKLVIFDIDAGSCRNVYHLLSKITNNIHSNMLTIPVPSD